MVQVSETKTLVERRVLIQCIMVVFYTALSALALEVQPPNDSRDDFVDMSHPHEPISWRSRLKVNSFCTTDKLVGITLYISTPVDRGQYGRSFQKFWRCHGNEAALQIRRVRIPLADDIAFRPSLFNKKSVFVEAAKLVVWMVDDITRWKLKDVERLHVHKWALNRKSYDVHVQPPYSRPYKTFRHCCVPWYWPLQRNPKLSDIEVCPAEQQIISFLSFPAVLNGQTYGFLREVSPFIDPVLELERNSSFLSPRFSLELWVYVEEFCPLSHLNAAGACSILCHVNVNEKHLTPCIVMDRNGLIQIEAASPDTYMAQKTKEAIPRRRWVRILFTMEKRAWTLSWSYGENHSETKSVQDRFLSDVIFNDAEGLYVVGGVHERLGSFLGYIGRVKLYRGQILSLTQLTMPLDSDPMLQFGAMPASDAGCQRFLDWVHHRLDFYSHKAAIYQSKRLCPNSYKQLLTGQPAHYRLLHCPRRPGALRQSERRVAQLLRLSSAPGGPAARRGNTTVAKSLLETVTKSVEKHGFRNIHQRLPLLEQASCLGNLDAAFTLAAFLNNGIGTTIQEAKSLSLLMQGALQKHRSSLLALGHRHVMGIDGVPVDRDVAYMYYKQIGDHTSKDREIHPEDQVITEKVRLMDEVMLSQQTDESGDLFMWLKHQAQQGVTSAQLHLAHLYFWGSQGMKRNIQAARQFFQQGAEQGDAESTYNLGILDLLGRGGSEKNETSAKHHLKKAAEKKHPYAICALGWIALERERNYSKAAALFEEAVALNLMDAGYYLGHMYQAGIYPNMTKDIDKAVDYYMWAAVRGHVVAALLFAHHMNRGTLNKSRQPALALEWARFIAEQNAAIGQLLREGVKAFRESNIPLATYHYVLAAETGIEVSSFNMAWLCEEFRETVTVAMKKECQWRHYNLTVQRESKFVDPYSFIKMGDYFWYGCQGRRNASQAARYYAAAAEMEEPHALFNLAFMVEEGAAIPTSVWKSLKVKQKHYRHKVTLLLQLYSRCRESRKSEAFIPCSLAFYRVWLLDLWDRYHVYWKTSTYLGCAVAFVGTVYFMVQWISRWRNNRVIQLYQL